MAFHWSQSQGRPQADSERSFRRGCWQFHPYHREVLGGIADHVIADLEIPNGIPLVCDLEADLKPFPKEFSTRLLAIPSVPS